MVKLEDFLKRPTGATKRDTSPEEAAFMQSNLHYHFKELDIIRVGLSLVDTLSHLGIENYQLTRVVNIVNSSISRKSGAEMTEGFRSFDAFRDPNRVK